MHVCAEATMDYVLLLLVPLLSTASAQCPHPCICYHNFDSLRSLTVDCRGQDLYEIPVAIPAETSSLYVVHCTCIVNNPIAVI